jgi:hypothetical protein
VNPARARRKSREHRAAVVPQTTPTLAAVSTHLVQTPAAKAPEWPEAERIADQLLAGLNEAEAASLILAANSPGNSSALVQGAILSIASALGFHDESKGLFAAYKTSALRPDFYRPVGGSGVLLEVERGKTTINTMDLLDFWKCHLCEHADYRFLMVPQELRQNVSMSPRREHTTVVRRLESFFVPGKAACARVNYGDGDELIARGRIPRPAHATSPAP